MSTTNQGEVGAEPVDLTGLRAADLERPGLVFTHEDHVFRTTGEHVGHGGMGNAFLLAPGASASADADTVSSATAVGKVFHSEYLYQLRTDEITRRDHNAVLAHVHVIAGLGHPNVLPILISAPIADNHITVTPRLASTLLHAISTGALSPRRRVELLVQSLRGLSALHAAGFVHRDFTLRNILVDSENRHAYVFDFDLALALTEVEGDSYRARYQGRIFGSPGFSVAPEVLDAQLMDSPISQMLDIYAIGGAVFALFSDELPYGPTQDMWSLLLRITEGVVFGGKSRIVYPEAVPAAVRPVIEACMERDPDRRTASVDQVIAALEAALPALSAEVAPAPAARDLLPAAHRTLSYGDPRARLSAVYASRRDLSVSLEEVRAIDDALARHGYTIQRAMGRIKGHPIFMAAPNVELVATGQFPDSNLYPKIVTALALHGESDPAAMVDRWMGQYLPILRAARQGLLTPLYRVVHDEASGHLFLFSEYVDDPRFGPSLEAHDLTLEEAFGLGYLVAVQVERLHSRGMAHRNVCAASLLLKGLRESRRVHPAMVGIVTPSLDPADLTGDVRDLAALMNSWLRPTRIEEAEAVYHERLSDVHRRIAEMAGGVGAYAIGDFLDAVADGLCAVDFNFGVLRESGGDLNAYALLLVSHALYGRLWRS
ncbi:MAG TPA: protein kinase [Kofleriaceae bacterium]|nr:protein kinase [Kofleriaceae bacterium]